MSEDRVVHKIARSRENEEIRATVGEYNGRETVSIRVYYRADDGTWRPTKKGITLMAESLGDLEESVKALRADLDAKAKRPRKESVDFRERLRGSFREKACTEPTPLGEVGAA